MTHLLRLGALRPALLAPLAVLLAAATSGCEGTFSPPGVGADAPTTEALALLPADADVVGMMNLAAARESEALEAALGGTGLGMMSGQGSEDFDEFVRMTGFDPAEDLDRVFVAATEGPNGTDGRAAFVAYGRFDRERIERFVADEAGGELEVTEIGGLPVYFATEEVGPRPGFALVNSQMVVAGDEATLRSMIARLGTKDTAAAPELQALLDRVAYPEGAWFVARNVGEHVGPVPADAGAPGLAARAAQSFVVSMAFQRDGVPVRAFVLTQDGADVDDVADAIRGGVAAAKMGMKDRPAAIDVLDRVEVDAERGGVDVEAFLTPDFLASAGA